jgi:serine/threonine protein kinase/Tfp pilus assembly protein PilF
MSNDSSPPRPGDSGNAPYDPDATCELPPGESHAPHADSDLTSSIPQVDGAGLAPAADPHATQSQGLDDLNLGALEQLVDGAAGKREANSIGPYKLRQRLGAGGMGEVWVAEQSEPVKRRVALKLIKGGLGSRESIARFEAERQALALMNHPNIARILDAGTTAEGQPYFVMELVAGQPLTQYCDENRLSIDQRLKLFLDVCGGVQHAHQKGIIHRDLKPGNIIVGIQDGVPVPKIIDFGLAKAMESTLRLTDQSLFTEIGQILGTLKYMSPEQASLDNLDIDTRTDIYALGVILYELLTGSTPLDDSSVKGQARLKVLEIIREKEPVKPSSKLGSSTDEEVSSITGQRQTDSVRLKRVLLGDLDWIVMKALEKDRTRRYDSASGFAADIRRYLHNEPVVARPPSLDYRVRKFVRKNQVGVLAAAVVLLTLVGGIIGTSLAMYRALAAEKLSEDRLVEANSARAKAEAETAAKELALAEETRQRQFAEAVTEFVEQDFLQLTSVEGQADLLEDASVRELGKDTTLRELLDRAAEKLKQRENLAPEIEARLCNVIGNSYRLNGDAAIGIPFLERALKLRREQFGTDHPDTLSSMNNLASGYYDAGQLEQALPLYEQTLELRKAKLGPDHPDTLGSMHNLALGYDAAGQLDRALPLYEQTLELMKAKLGPDHPDTLSSMNNLAGGYRDAGQLDRALPLYEQTLELRKAKLGPDHPDTLGSMDNLAGGYRDAGQLDQALPLFEQTLELRKAKLGPDHPDALSSKNNLAGGYLDAGQFDRALPLFEQTLELRKAKLGPDHPDTLVSISCLASGYDDAGQPDKALPLFEQTLELMKAKLGPDHPNTLTTMHNLALAYQQNRQLDQALPLFEQTLEQRKAKLGPDHPDTLGSMNNLALGYSDAGQLDYALPLFEQTLELRKAKLGPDHPDTLSSMNNLAGGYRDAGQLDKALPLFEQTLELRKAKLGPDHPDTLGSMNNLALGYYDAGQLDYALPLFEQTLELMKAKLGPDHPDTLVCINCLASGYDDAGQLDKSLPLFEELLELQKAKLGPGHFEVKRLELLVWSMAMSLKTEVEEELVELKKLVNEPEQLATFLSRSDAVESKLRAVTRQDAKGLASGLGRIAQLLIAAEAWQPAETRLREMLEIRQQQSPQEWTTFNTQSALGQTVLKQGRLTEAEPLLLAGYQGLETHRDQIPTSVRDIRLPEALDRLIELYTLLERPEEVAKYRDLRAQYPELKLME